MADQEDDAEEEVEFKVETPDGEATITLGSEIAKEWHDIISEQLENGPGGMIRVPIVNLETEVRQHVEIAPLAAETIRDIIEDKYEVGG